MDEGPIEIGRVIDQVLDDLCLSPAAKEFKETLKRQSADRIEALIEDYMQKVGKARDPGMFGLIVAEEIMLEAEILREKLQNLLLWTHNPAAYVPPPVEKEG